MKYVSHYYAFRNFLRCLIELLDFPEHNTEITTSIALAISKISILGVLIKTQIYSEGSISPYLTITLVHPSESPKGLAWHPHTKKGATF